MRPVPIPPDELPDGAQLDPSGLAYLDAVIAPVTNPANGLPHQVAVPRTSQLIEASPTDVQTMARHGWRLWVRITPLGAAGLMLQAEPYLPIARPTSLFLNSDPSDPEGH